MTEAFAEDLAGLTKDLIAARKELQALLGQLTDGQLSAARRGGWTIGQVGWHVAESDWYYARLVRRLRDLGPVEAEAEGAPGVAALAAALERSFAALLEAVDGVDEETFYRLGGGGHQEYSVLSVLENSAMHDREHGAQIERIVANVPAAQ